MLDSKPNRKLSLSIAEHIRTLEKSIRRAKLKAKFIEPGYDVGRRSNLTLRTYGGAAFFWEVPSDGKLADAKDIVLGLTRRLRTIDERVRMKSFSTEAGISYTWFIEEGSKWNTIEVFSFNAQIPQEEDPTNRTCIMVPVGEARTYVSYDKYRPVCPGDPEWETVKAEIDAQAEPEPEEPGIPGIQIVVEHKPPF